MEVESTGSTALGATLHENEVVCVEQHGVERGSERFPNNGVWRPPDTAQWRNNLTALSQHRNLYFVACNNQIHVYQPTLSGHTLGPSPLLILAPRLKNPSAPGYIWPPVPHSINSILVGDLGNEEILLLATDSGNVSAYRTERIYSVIEENKAASELTPTALGTRVDCFFAEWVGQSAWGLAIHKLARIIAVSANTSLITVFAFALVNDANVSGGHVYSPPSIHEQEWKDIHRRAQFKALRKLSWRERRARNLRLTFEGHRTNIPCVSFLNCDLDPEGDWMFSTDINNQLLIWNVWRDPTPLHRSDFSREALRRHGSDDSNDSPNYYQDPFDNHRGWHVMALDPRDFRVKRSIAEACGGEPQISSQGQNGKIVDLSSLAAHVRDSSRDYEDFESPHETEVLDGPPADEIFSPSSPTAGDAPALESLQATNNLDTISNTAFNTEQDRETEFQTTIGLPGTGIDASMASLAAGPSSDTLMLPPPLGSQPLPNAEDSDGGLSMVSLDIVVAGEGGSSESSESHEELEDPISDQDNIEVHVTDQTDSDEDDFDEGDPWPAQIANIYSAPPQGHSNINPSSPEPESASQKSEEPDGEEVSLFRNFPIIQFSEINIRFLQGPYEEPSVIFNGPFYQRIRSGVSSLQMWDRFNMAHYISELGIVVAASQKGRAGIFALTEVSNVGKFFRLEAIIPFKSQERKRLRPLKPLVGIAVGPVESHLAPVVESKPLSRSDLATSTDKDDSEKKKEREGDNHASGSHKRKAARTDVSHDSQKTDTSPSRLPYGASELLRHEHWRGGEYSRRYRILMMYSDHTILRYELYYKWPMDMVGPRGKAELDAC